MKTIRMSALLLLAFGPISILQCAAQNPIQAGGYVRNEYAQVLEASKSPLKAGKTARPQSGVVSREKDGISLRTFYDFNEGGPVFKMVQDGSVSLVEGAARTPDLRIKDASSFTLAYEGHPNAEYKFVHDIGKYVGRTCLVGKYATSSGLRAEFTEQGEFILANSRKRYSVGLYYPPAFKRDYFIADSTEQGFARSGDTLMLYDVTGGSLFEDGKMNPVPSQVLIQIHK